MKQQQPFAVADIVVNFLDQIVGMTIHDHQIEVSVVVIVEEFQAPSAHQFSSIGDSRRRSDVVKSFVVPILIEAVKFVIQIGHEKIHPSILVEVGGVDSHARTRLSTLAIGYA